MSGALSVELMRVLTGDWHASADCCDGLSCLTADSSGCGPVKKLVFDRSFAVRAAGIGHENDQVP
jgi:hypothetical protein